MVKITSDSSILKNKDLNFVDMHHHINIADGQKTAEFLAKHFSKKGIGLCIADHNQIKGSVFLQRFSRRKKLFTIPSTEITSKQAKDILGYFYSFSDLASFWEKEIKKSIRNNAGFNLNRTNIDTFDLVNKIKKYNGVAILAHPFSLKPKKSYTLLKGKEFLKNIDGIESHNFGVGGVDKTMRLVKNLNKPLIAGSDHHDIAPMNCLTGSHAFDIEGFLKSILKKKNIIYYKEGYKLNNLFNKWIIFKNNMHLIAPKNE